jgi:hypothetical protein
VGQLSFFSADVSAPRPEHLDGLLCGPGQVVRHGGSARISVVVLEEWRVVALRAALAGLDLDGGVAEPEGGGIAVRTPFAPELVALADAWGEGAAKRPPPGLVLDGARLRWWLLAAGRPDPLGYVLGLGPQDGDPAWSGVGAALARSGLPATFLGPRADGPAYRVTGQRRLRRLLELVGQPPSEAAAGCWPS